MNTIPMSRLRLSLLVPGLVLIPFWAAPQTIQKPPAVYYPDAEWQRKTPAEAGINPQLLKAAIDFAIAKVLDEFVKRLLAAVTKK